jgi:protein-tyrosine sulfotransferase
VISWKSDPAVILGPPRSGTTLLRRLLNAHPKICSPPEPYVISSCARFLRDEPTARGVPVGPVTGLWYSGFDEEYLLDKLRGLIDEIYSDICVAAGKPRWVDKDGFTFFYIDQVERLFGDSCRYVCIIRHGFDVAISLEELYNRLGGYPQECHEYIRRYPIVLEAWAHLWADVMARLLRFSADHAASTLLIRYEELTADPMATMAEVARFLGESYQPEYLQAALADRADVGLGDWKTYEKDSVEPGNSLRWRSQPQPVVAAVGRIVNPMLEAYGYDLVRSTDPGPDYAKRVARAWRAAQRPKSATDRTDGV